MSVAGGTFGVSRAIRGGAHSCVQSSALLGYWPMRQSTGSDWDGSTVADRSGNGRDASFGLLTAAEIGDNAGYATSLAEAGHSVKLPYASWPHRWATDALLVFGQMLATAPASSEEMWGNGASTSVTGPRLQVTSTGRLQLVAHGTSGSSNSGVATGSPVWETSTLRSWMLAYDPTDSSLTLGVAAADSLDILSRDTTIPASRWPELDQGASIGEYSLTGRTGTGSAGLANQSRYQQAYYWPGQGLPMSDARLAQLFARYNSHPFLLFRDEDFTG